MAVDVKSATKSAGDFAKKHAPNVSAGVESIVESGTQLTKGLKNVGNTLAGTASGSGGALAAVGLGLLAFVKGSASIAYKAAEFTAGLATKAVGGTLKMYGRAMQRSPILTTLASGAAIYAGFKGHARKKEADQKEAAIADLTAQNQQMLAGMAANEAAYVQQTDPVPGKSFVAAENARIAANDASKTTAANSR